jgi:hypothetical protein
VGLRDLIASLRKGNEGKLEASVATNAPIRSSVSTPRVPGPYKGMISLAADRVNQGRDRKDDIRHIFLSKFIFMMRLPRFYSGSNEADE